MTRGASPYALRGTPLAIPNGTLANPAVRFGRERSGFYRIADGQIGLGVKKFTTLAVTQTELSIRSASPGAGSVTPLVLVRANATTANGQETGVDVYEGLARVGRLATYRQSATQYGWRLYCTTNGLLSGAPDLVVDAGGNASVRGTLVANSDLTSGGTFRALGPAFFSNTVTVSGQLQANGPGTGLSVANNATIGGTLSVGGYMTVTGFGLDITPPTGGSALNIRTNAGGGYPLIALTDGPSARSGLLVLQTTATPTGLGSAIGDLSLYTTSGKLILGTNVLPRLTLDTNGQATFSGDLIGLGSISVLPPANSAATFSAIAQGPNGNVIVALNNATSNRQGYLALQGGATGYGLGSGVGDVSLWTTNGSLILGANNAGRLFISPAGVVSVPGAFTVKGQPITKPIVTGFDGFVLLPIGQTPSAQVAGLGVGTWLIWGNVSWLVGDPGDTGQLLSCSIGSPTPALLSSVETAYLTVPSEMVRSSSQVMAILTVTAGTGTAWVTVGKNAGTGGAHTELVFIKAIYLGMP